MVEKKDPVVMYHMSNSTRFCISSTRGFLRGNDSLRLAGDPGLDVMAEGVVPDDLSIFRVVGGVGMGSDERHVAVEHVEGLRQLAKLRDENAPELWFGWMSATWCFNPLINREYRLRAEGFAGRLLGFDPRVCRCCMDYF